MTKFQYYIKIYLHYDPEICRFITIDDISYLNPDVINGVNLYAYCGNNPIMNVDPSGTDWWNPFSWDWESIAKIAVGAAIVVGLAVASVATAGTVSVVLAGAVTIAGLGASVIFSKYERKTAAPRIKNKSKNEAYDKAFYKGGKKTPIGPENHGVGWHYHPNVSNDSVYRHWHYLFNKPHILLMILLDAIFGDE